MNTENTSDGLSDLLSAFDEVAGAEKSEPARAAAPKRGRTRQPAYRSALSEGQTSRRQTAQATGKKATLAGQYMRRSFTFRPDQLAEIEQTAASLGLSQNDLIRWFTDLGLESVAQGTRPPVAEEIRHRYDPTG
jgi:hypothetical protein